MTNLHEGLRQCATKIEKYRGRTGKRLNEANTKASLVEVVLRALGWDTADTDEVDREYRRIGRYNPTDYALILPDRHDRPCAVVEAKALGCDLADPRVISQALGYATDSGAPCAVITDGDAWHLYDAHATEPGKDRLYRVVSVSDDEESAAEVLLLLTKEALRAGTLQELRRGERADRQLEEGLHRLFDTNGPVAHELEALLKPLLPDLAPVELRGALSRLRLDISFERQRPAAASARSASPVPARSAGTRPSGTGKLQRRSPPTTYRSVSEIEARLTVRDLMAADRLVPGPLTGTYKGETYSAELLADGTIEYRGTVYSSVSSAACAVKRVSTDRGWNWWYTEDHHSGDRVTLLEVRRRWAAVLEARQPT
jgi:hypothetical protein